MQIFKSIQTKFIFYFLAVALIPLIIVGWLTFNQSHDFLLEQTSQELIGIRDLKAGELETFFNLVDEDVVLLSKLPMMAEAMQDFAETEDFYDVRMLGYLNHPDMIDSGNGTPYDTAHARYHPVFQEIVKFRDYSEVYLINPKGFVVYNYDKGNDFATELITGDYRDTHLAKLFHSLITITDTNMVNFTDFVPYSPSGDIPSGFIGTPIIHGDENVGVLVFQVPLARINKLMNNRLHTIGETGEAYVVGNDKYLRTASRLLGPESILKQMVDNVVVQQALQGKSDVRIVKNYQGTSVLSAYQPIKFGNETWVLLVEIPESEALALANSLRNVTMIIVLISTFLVIGVGIFSARNVTNPILQLTNTTRQIAEGDLDKTVSIHSDDEIGQLAKTFNLMTNQLRRLIEDLKENARQLAESEKKYRAVFEDSNDLILITDIDGYINDASPACEYILGYTRAEFKLVNLVDICTNPNDGMLFVNKILSKGSVRDFELKFKRKDNEHIDVLVTATGRYAEDDTIIGFQGIVRDVTAMKQAQKERLKLTTLQRELAIAQDMQASLLPPSKPDWKTLDVVCFSTPAKEVGGDFYTYHAFKTGHFVFAVGDISGKGVAASLLMATSLSQFDSSLSLDLSPTERMMHLDKNISSYTQPRHQNCAMCYVEIISDSSSKTDNQKTSLLYVVNAGCIPPYIRRSDGSVEHFIIGGFPLGTGFGVTLGYEQHIFELLTGDMVILTSDGIVEANNEENELLGFDNLEQIIKDFVPPVSTPSTQGEKQISEVESMLEYIKQRLFDFTGHADQHDDMTIMVIQI